MFFERPGGGERAILVHLDGQDPARARTPGVQELARSAGAETVGFVNVSRHQPSAKFLIGSGKVEELHDLVKEGEAELVIFNHTLTPSQERNLERALECRVLDRTGLILDIFAQRAYPRGQAAGRTGAARTHEHAAGRGWTHLERQKGGIGLRGRVKPSWRPTVACCACASGRSSSVWKRSVASASPAVAGVVRTFLPCRWWVTPTPASPRYSML